MKTHVKFMVIFAAALLMLAGSTAFGADNALTQTAQANNTFAFDVFLPLCNSQAGKNVFISPYSISCALAMTYDGAKNKTASQMAKAMHFPADKGVLESGFSGLQKMLNAKNAGYALATANSLWPQKDYPFLKDYMQAVEKYYGGKAEEVDYVSKRAEAVNKINSWTSEQTKEKIPKILSMEDVDALTRMVLVNAIYFKGSWAVKFSPKLTKKSDFYLNDDKKISADMMHAKIKTGYAEQDGVKILEMPYAGGDISMIAVLPKERYTSKLEKTITYAIFQKWVSSLNHEEVDVSFPKFKIHCMYGLNEPLKGLGMTDAFDENLADFSGMTGKKDLFITSVIHASFVDVNEEGTEAAAATAVIMGAKSIEWSREFVADHPFLFFIYDRAAGAILFMGRIEDPETEEGK